MMAASADAGAPGKSTKPQARAKAKAKAKAKQAARARRITQRRAPKRLQSRATYLKALRRANVVLKQQKRRAIVRLQKGLPTIVIPDVHARTGYLASVLAMKDPVSGQTYGALLRAKKIQLVVVGDGMHAEARAERRWLRAESDPLGPAMKAEMGESLGTMKQIMELKATYPDHFHYLKGNHDNILNQRRGGDYPVVKYTNVGEGHLVRNYIEKKYGRAFLEEYASFERSIPIVAVGKDLVVSHSAPEKALSADAIRRRSGRTVENFTWTDLTENTPKQARIVKAQLRKLGLGDKAVYLAGHRPTGEHRWRRQGQLVQINSDDRRYFAVVRPGKPFSPRTDIVEARRLR